MRTSFDIPDGLFQRAKKLARERNTTLRALLLEGLSELLQRERPRANQYQMKDCSFGTGGLVEGLEWTDSDRLRDLTYEGWQACSKPPK